MIVMFVDLSAQDEYEAGSMSKEDFREVARIVRPDIDDEQYARMWDEWAASKVRQAMH